LGAYLLRDLDETACLWIPFRKTKKTLTTFVGLLSISGAAYNPPAARRRRRIIGTTDQNYYLFIKDWPPLEVFTDRLAGTHGIHGTANPAWCGLRVSLNKAGLDAS